MTPNPAARYMPPRDPIETAAGYVILLIVAVVAIVPVYLADRVPGNVTVAAKSEAAAAPQRDATSRTETF